jgi:oligopeptide/dipeptide ABC transporter ATP-binding protein
VRLHVVLSSGVRLFMSDIILDVKDLHTYIFTRWGVVKAVDGVSMAMIFITHDFGIVACICDQIAVMYAGLIVERGPVRDVFNQPSHPYTQALLASVPTMEERVEWLASIEGQRPALDDLPVGCRFAPRCAYADERCHAAYPPAFAVGAEHSADCWRLEHL